MSDRPPEGWLVEQGIGEERAILYRKGHPEAARIRWPGGLEAGQIATGILAAKAQGSTRGRATFSSGEEALVDRLPRDASEGSEMRFRVIRPAIGEARRRKLAQVSPTNEAERPAPSLVDCLPDARAVPRFPDAQWEDILEMAVESRVVFAGGALELAATPGMVIVDVDGTLPSRELALAAVEAVARTLRLLDIGGPVGIDFPTLSAKSDRKKVDMALEEALSDFNHERTAMNGFGFVQIVSRFERPSLLHLVSSDPTGAVARAFLRRAEAVKGAGRIELTAHPALIARLKDDWLAQLGRRTGREVSIRADAALAVTAPHAQIVPL